MTTESGPLTAIDTCSRDLLEDLLPCPFCGSNLLRIRDTPRRDEGTYLAVECLKCDATNRLEFWNQRVES